MARIQSGASCPSPLALLDSLRAEEILTSLQVKNVYWPYPEPALASAFALSWVVDLTLASAFFLPVAEDFTSFFFSVEYLAWPFLTYPLLGLGVALAFVVGVVEPQMLL